MTHLFPQKCDICKKSMTLANSPSTIGCFQCNTWFHMKCTGLTKPQITIIAQLNDCIEWFCPICSKNKKMPTV